MIRRAIDRFATVKHAVHGAVDLGLTGLAALGADPARRRVPVQQLVAERASVRFHPLEEGGRVEVAAPSARHDPSPGRFAALCATASRGYELRPAGRLEIDDARISLPGGVVMADGAIPSETILQQRFPRSFQYAGVLRAAHGRARPIPEGVFFALPLSLGYYHWLCEILPLAIRASSWPEVAGLPIYVPAGHPPFVREHLAALGLAERCVELGPGVHRAERLHVPTLPSRAEWPSPAHVRLVRDALLGVAPDDGRGPRRVYISRADAGERRLLNEHELVGRLAEHGFTPVCLSGMAPLEQVRLFAGAEHVVAPHGAGTANMIFGPPGMAVMELVGDRHFAPCYQILASALGADHRYVRCEDRRRDLVAPVQAVVDLVAASLYPGGAPAAAR